MKVLTALTGAGAVALGGAYETWLQVEQVAPLGTPEALEVRLMSSNYPVGQVILPCQSGRYREHRVGLKAPVDPTVVIRLAALQIKLGGTLLFSRIMGHGGPTWQQEFEVCCGLSNQIIVIRP